MSRTAFCSTIEVLVGHCFLSDRVGMTPFYIQMCHDLKLPLEEGLLEELRARNADKLSDFEEKIKDAEENLGDVEQRDALLSKAEYLSMICDKVGQIIAGYVHQVLK